MKSISRFSPPSLLCFRDRYYKILSHVTGLGFLEILGQIRSTLPCESELERIRSRALKQFHDDIVDIDQIAGGAKAKAAERQRNEEFKAKEKANTIRKTGKLPRTCFCF
ncbi:hypothetical protein NC651_024952 [Populus alba x Populus x berolinensis]|nr:hypothetical protein NC651_024952 [Populus alba x Populus x berolinensis]